MRAGKSGHVAHLEGEKIPCKEGIKSLFLAVLMKRACSRVISFITCLRRETQSLQLQKMKGQMIWQLRPLHLPAHPLHGELLERLRRAISACTLAFTRCRRRADVYGHVHAVGEAAKLTRARTRVHRPPP